MFIVQYSIHPFFGRLTSLEQEASRCNQSYFWRKLKCNVVEQVVYWGFSAADAFFLVRRVADYSVEFHVVVVYVAAVGLAFADFLDEVGGLVLDLVYQVLEMARVDPQVAEADECAARNALRHRGLADDEDVLPHGLCPYCPFVFDCLNGGDLVAEASAVCGVCHVQGVQSGLGVDFEDVRVGVEHFGCHLAPVNEARLGNRFLEVLVEEAVAAECVGDVHVDYAPRCQHGLNVRVAERCEQL